MTGTVGALATGMIVGAYGGQNKSVVTDNLELRAFRTDCGTRDAAFRLSSGAGVTDLPASALDAAAGGGSCDADATEAPADVDVKVAQLKNVHASEGDGTVSDLVQIELGGEGATVMRGGGLALLEAAARRVGREVELFESGLRARRVRLQYFLGRGFEHGLDAAALDQFK